MNLRTKPQNEADKAKGEAAKKARAEAPAVVRRSGPDSGAKVDTLPGPAAPSLKKSGYGKGQNTASSNTVVSAPCGDADGSSGDQGTQQRQLEADEFMQRLRFHIDFSRCMVDCVETLFASERKIRHRLLKLVGDDVEPTAPSDFFGVTALGSSASPSNPKTTRSPYLQTKSPPKDGAMLPLPPPPKAQSGSDDAASSASVHQRSTFTPGMPLIGDRMLRHKSSTLDHLDGD